MILPCKHLYFFQDSTALASALLAELEDPAFAENRRLYLGYSTSLSPEATRALALSPLARGLHELELHEVFITTGQLQELLTLPLESLVLTGGYSQDWGGTEFVWPSINAGHLDVLRAHRGLQRLTLRHQQVYQLEGFDHLKLTLD